MQALYTSPVHFDRVLFMNDVYFCEHDMLELLRQSMRHDADITCGLDMDAPYGFGFYDTWVYRDLAGHMLTVKTQVLPDMSADYRPFRALCCWNGAAVLNTDPFVKDTLRFRRSMSDECSASECSLLCKDFIARGYDRVLVVPSVMLVYKAADLEMLAGMYHRLPRIHEFADSPVEFPQLAPDQRVDCAGLVGTGMRSPDQPVIQEHVRVGTSVHRKSTSV
jgi:alpha-1,3-mannosyltransferase